MANMVTYIQRLGMNRGKRRLWLEGNRLSKMGIKVGDLITVFFKKDPNRIVIVRGERGNRRVTGKGDKPIIDINTDALEILGTKGSPLEISGCNGILTVEPLKRMCRNCNKQRTLVNYQGAKLDREEMSHVFECEICGHIIDIDDPRGN